MHNHCAAKWEYLQNLQKLFTFCMTPSPQAVYGEHKQKVRGSGVLQRVEVYRDGVTGMVERIKFKKGNMRE